MAAPPLYTIFCILALDNVQSAPFSVKIESSATVDELKKKIKEQKPIALQDTDADGLVLYQVDIGDDNEREKKVAQIMEELSLGKQTQLKETRKLGKIYPTDPPEETIHIIAQLPSRAGQKRKREDDDPVLTLRFHAPQKGVFSLDSNNIREISADACPEFVTNLKKILGQDRPIAQTATKIVNDTNSSALKGLTAAEIIELSHQLMITKWSNPQNKYSKNKEKFFYGCCIFTIEQYLMATQEFTSITSEQNKSWGFSLVASVQGAGEFSYTPRSDWQLEMSGIPCLHVEVSSNQDESDKIRMLIQAACLVRSLNKLGSSKSPESPEPLFVDVCIYVSSSLIATRHLVFQRGVEDAKVEYEQRQFDLRDEQERKEFLIELYNYPLAAKRWARLFQKANEDKRLKGANDLNLPGFTTRTGPSKRSKTEPTVSSSNAGSKSAGTFGDPTIRKRLGDCGYQLIEEVDIPDWKPLNPLKPTLCKAKDSSGKRVILKVVKSRSSEVRIHRMLYEIQSPCNHTIPLLDEMAFEYLTIIAVPHATPLTLTLAFDHLSNDRHDLICQFLEGVAFMHEHLVAHLDLKPDNIVVKKDSGHLFIIDFGTSVQVKSPEDLITGYRGTSGWVAPEVGWDNAPNETFSPIHADLWACGKMLEWFFSHCTLDGLDKMEDLAAALLDTQPANRPLLTPSVLQSLKTTFTAQSKAESTEKLDEYTSLTPFLQHQPARCLPIQSQAYPRRGVKRPLDFFDAQNKNKRMQVELEETGTTVSEGQRWKTKHTTSPQSYIQEVTRQGGKPPISVTVGR